MFVREIMNKEVITVEGTVTVQEAAKLMNEHNVGCLIVVKNKELTGIVTERDFLSKVIVEGRNPTKTPVQRIMTKEVVLGKPDLDVQEAVDIMHEKGIKKLPIVKGNKLVGIVTVSDICSVEPKFIEKLSALFLFPRRKKNVAG
jgi:CBS domain-containing protein